MVMILTSVQKQWVYLQIFPTTYMKRWKTVTMESTKTDEILTSIRKNKKLKTTLIAFVLLGPALIISLVFTYYPTLYVIRLSFMDWNLINPDQVFVGLDNFQRLFAAGSEFWPSLYRTLEYGVIYIFLSIFFSKVLKHNHQELFFQELKI